MKINLVSGGWRRNFPWATELAFQKGFERLGVDIHVVDTAIDSAIDMTADAVIVFKDAKRNDLKEQIAAFEGPSIVYQSDDMRFQHIKEDMIQANKYCEYAVLFEWDGTKSAIEIGYKRATSIMLPVDDTLFRKIPVPKVLDVCFVGNISNEFCHASRRKMVDIVNGMNLKFIATTNFNIPQMVHLYNSSKIVLHHATNVGQPFGHGFGYQSRHFEVGFSGACLLSNEVKNESRIRGIYYFCDEQELVERIKEILFFESWETNGSELRKEMHNKHRPEHRAQEMLDFIEKCR